MLDEKSHQMLIEKFKPKYAKVLAHHITLEYGCSAEEANNRIKVFEECAEDSRIVVKDYLNSVEHSADCITIFFYRHTRKNNGEKLHITLSVAEGVSPVVSNKFTDIQMPDNFWIKSNPDYQYSCIAGTMEFIPFQSKPQQKESE